MKVLDQLKSCWLVLKNGCGSPYKLLISSYQIALEQNLPLLSDPVEVWAMCAMAYNCSGLCLTLFLKDCKECPISIFCVAVWSCCSKHLTCDPEVIGSHSWLACHCSVVVSCCEEKTETILFVKATDFNSFINSLLQWIVMTVAWIHPSRVHTSLWHTCEI